jgi:hypothetical protein
MRSWSIYMTLEHLAITNEMIISIVRSLALEKPILWSIDFSRAVMPSENPGAEQISAFQASVKLYRKKAAWFGKFKSRTLSRHPVFGMFDVHKWRCMAGFHLYIHRRQIEKIISLLSRKLG